MNNQGPILSSQTFWKKCSTCKKEIAFGDQYYLCSVSTCRHSRTGFRFCSVGCWDAHLGYANHRSSFAEESKAPSKESFLSTLSEEADTKDRPPVRKIIAPNSAPSTQQNTATALQTKPPVTDTLVVVSKVKQLIRSQSEFNTSECCIEALTRKVTQECLRGIENAKAMGRKTVMGRDIN